MSTAVAARDGAQLYQALDLETRWSWMTIRRSHREAYDIVLSNFPEGPGRDQAVHRFEAGALSEDEARLFAAQLTADKWATLAAKLSAHPTFIPITTAEVRVTGKDGEPLLFRKGTDSRWGYIGFANEAEEIKRRALVDLDLTRSSAADYERAATRNGK